MKKLLLSALAVLSLYSFTAVAQDSDDKKDEKRKAKVRTSNGDEIVIRRVDGKDAKVVIEIRDNEVLVNGKPIEDYDGDDVSIQRRKSSTYNLLTPSSPFRGNGGTWNYDADLFNNESAFLGVSTEADDEGAKVISVTDESAAEKAGLKKGDVIKRINETKVEDHDDLSKAINKLKPEDKVKITYLRNGDERTVTATLGKRKGMDFGFTPNIDINPRFETLPKMDFDFDDGNFNRFYSFGAKGRLGIRAQDTEDGDGAKVIDVEEGSAAEKAGIRKDDIITEFEGNEVHSADELAEAARDAREKSSMKLKINRDGSSKTIEVKIAKKLKTSQL
jgi:serine protease Do